jgi:hypothetical protein
MAVADEERFDLDVFISYSSRDKEWVRHARFKLSRRDCRCFIRPGRAGA